MDVSCVSLGAQTVFSACELGVFDVLLAADHPLSAEDVSRAVGASLDGTERLLAACAGLQLLNTHRQDGQGVEQKKIKLQVFGVFLQLTKHNFQMFQVQTAPPLQ